MSSATQVPLRPLKRGSLAKLWLGILLLIGAALLLAAAGAGQTGGVRVKTLAPGSGLTITADDGVLIEYEGKLDDGTVFDTSAGRKHFQTLCASCHKLGEDGTRLGPDLTGSGKNGINYYLENIIDPNAVIGTDFQMTVVETKDGDLISGLLINESPDAITLRTTASEEKIAKSNIARRQLSDKSLMPEGLLDTLGDRERIELLKYLTTH